MAVGQECKTNSSWRYFCCSSIVCIFCSIACTWGRLEVPQIQSLAHGASPHWSSRQYGRNCLQQNSSQDLSPSLLGSYLFPCVGWERGRWNVNTESTSREMLSQGIVTGVYFSFLPLQIWPELELVLSSSPVAFGRTGGAGRGGV